MQSRELELTELTAIWPGDGRYWGEKANIRDLSPYASEMALIKSRVEIETRYLVALSDVGLVRPLDGLEREALTNMGPNMTMDETEEVKAIERGTRHDVKAMERVLRKMLGNTSLADTIEMVHFALTSEDVNNLAYRLMLDRARKDICVPALDDVVDGFAQRADQYRGVPMLARTHGQAAVPTTLGKEMANFAVRLNRQTRKIEDVELTGKLNGAVGNYNAMALAAPEINWIAFSENFVKSLGLKPNLITTQINTPDDLIELFQAFQRANGVLLDIDQDMWRYISDDWFSQIVKEGEVGSSTMTQKVNPIDFENSEGNSQMANSIWQGMGNKLAVSRLQRDLSDSTTVRNIGVGLGYGLLAYRNTLAGLQRVTPNADQIHKDLHENWSILTEGAQTVLRRAEVEDPYTMVAGLSRGRKIDASDWQTWIDELPVEEEHKASLRDLTPDTYIGYADQLTDIALEEIKTSRKQ